MGMCLPPVNLLVKSGMDPGEQMCFILSGLCGAAIATEGWRLS